MIGLALGTFRFLNVYTKIGMPWWKWMLYIQDVDDKLCRAVGSASGGYSGMAAIDADDGGGTYPATRSNTGPIILFGLISRNVCVVQNNCSLLNLIILKITSIRQ